MAIFVPSKVALRLLAVLGLAVLVGCSGPRGAESRQTADGDRRLNILILVADDLGFSDLGFLSSCLEAPATSPTPGVSDRTKHRPPTRKMAYRSSSPGTSTPATSTRTG